MPRIRVTYRVEVSDEMIAAYCEYYHHDPTNRRQAIDGIRTTCEQVGKMGLVEILHEGTKWLEAKEETE